MPYTYIGKTREGRLLATSEKWATEAEARAAAKRHAKQHGETVSTLDVVSESPVQAAP